MKKITISLSILLILLIAVPSAMAKAIRYRSFTQMQATNGASLSDGDSGIIVTLQDDATYPSETHSCTLDADSGAAESLPTVVSFTSNANDKRFLCERIDGMASGTTAGGDLTGTYPDPTIDADSVKDTSIDWGTGAGQVSAVDVPIADAGGLITGTEVETALQENRGAIDTNTGLAHAEIHTVVSHDTDTTGAELTSLADDSVIDIHDHSRVSASDGTPNNAIDCDADGDCTASGDTELDGAVTINESGADKDFRVEGDTDENLIVTDASTDTVGIGTAPVSTGKLYVVSTDISALRTSVLIEDDTAASGWGFGPSVVLSDTNGATKNFQGIKNFYTIKNSGNLTGNVSAFNASQSQKLDTGSQTSTWSNIFAFTYSNTVNVAGGDSLTITEQNGYNSRGITNLSAGGTYNLTSFNHFKVEDSITSGEYNTFDVQTGLWVDALDAATTNYGIALDGDGSGSDIAQGASQNSTTSFDGTDYLINPDAVGTGTIAYIINDAAGTPSAPTLKTKRWFYNKSCANGTDDCFILPIPTTSGRVSCHINGTDQADCSWIITNAGVVTETEDNLTDDCNVTKDTADAINLYDTATIANATAIENVTGATEVVICEMIYD